VNSTFGGFSHSAGWVDAKEIPLRLFAKSDARKTEMYVFCTCYSLRGLLE